jgi:hypothetical protein
MRRDDTLSSPGRLVKPAFRSILAVPDGDLLEALPAPHDAIAAQGTEVKDRNLEPVPITDEATDTG